MNFVFARCEFGQRAWPPAAHEGRVDSLARYRMMRRAISATRHATRAACQELAESGAARIAITTGSQIPLSTTTPRRSTAAVVSSASRALIASARSQMAATSRSRLARRASADQGSRSLRFARTRRGTTPANPGTHPVPSYSGRRAGRETEHRELASGRRRSRRVEPAEREGCLESNCPAHPLGRAQARKGSELPVQSAVTQQVSSHGWSAHRGRGTRGHTSPPP